ncbi:hypothetical protein FTX61_00435 [Nitriliruptoraceae bacterium ZYF776]|nr:hypothetical protein [Profundirhabdus halotolerans]
MKPGTRLYSAVSDCEIVVVRPPATVVGVTCGGHPMVTDVADAGDRDLPVDAPGEAAIGKRYVHDGSGLEVLCTKAGAGQLAVDGQPLELLEARALPSSD